MSSTAGRNERGKNDGSPFLVIYSWIFHLIFIPFFRTIWVQLRIWCLEGGRGQKSGFGSNELGGWRGKKEIQKGNERLGFHVCSSKWEAGLEGDRLCLLLICQPVNGERRGEKERAELLSRKQSMQVWEPKRTPSNKLPHTWFACPYSFSNSTLACQISNCKNSVFFLYYYKINHFNNRGWY